MTLDFKKLVLNSVKKEMSIQHFECNAQLFKKEELPQSVLEKIQQVYGQDFAEDANYTLWFSGNNITKETIEKTIFKICNNALGRAANNMNESDLKTLDLGGGTAQPPPEKPATEVGSLADAGADEANGEAIADLMGGDGEDGEDAGRTDAEIQDELDSGDGDEEDQIDAEVQDELDSDDEDSGEDEDSEDSDEDQIDADIQDELDSEEDSGDDEEDDEDSEDDEELDESVEAPSVGEKFVFIKITMK